MVSGSGPTVLGLFAQPDGEGLALAQKAARELGERAPAALCAVPVEADIGEVHEL